MRGSATPWSSKRRAGGLAPPWLFAAVVLVALGYQATPARERIDGLAFDSIARLFRAYAPRAAEDAVVIVGIDEATERALEEPFAMWHAHIGQVLAGIAAAKPAAIALDVVLPDRSYDAVKPGLDAALVAGLAAAKAAGPLAIGLALDAGGQPRPVNPLLLAAAGEETLSLAYAVADADGTARRFAPGLDQGARGLPLLTERIMRSLGREARGGMIDFACGQPFSYVPFVDVLRWSRNGQPGVARATFAGRIAIVGSVLPDVDRVRQPLSLAGWESGFIAPPGVVLQAQILRVLQAGCMIEPVPRAVTIALAVLAALVMIVRRTAGVWVSSLLAAVALCAVTVALYRRGVFVPPSAALLSLFLAATARTARDAIEQRRERVEIERRFSGYVSANVLAGILSDEIDADRPRKLPNLAFLFADIRGFTALSERMPAERVVDLLNRYYEVIVPVVHAHGGTVDNFQGDGLMAVFGAPAATREPARDASLAAREMFAVLRGLNERLSADGFEPLSIGIGLAAGEAVVGNIGAADRHDYTAIGNAVNVAARLQSQCKSLGMRLIATAEIASAGVLTLEPLGALDLAGHTPVQAFGWPAEREGGEYSAARMSTGR